MGYATSDSKFDYEKDIAFTLNDRNEVQTAQRLLKMAQTPASGVALLTEEIPTSCWQPVWRSRPARGSGDSRIQCLCRWNAIKFENTRETLRQFPVTEHDSYCTCS